MKIMFLECDSVATVAISSCVCYVLLLESIQLYRQNVHGQLFAT